MPIKSIPKRFNIARREPADYRTLLKLIEAHAAATKDKKLAKAVADLRGIPKGPRRQVMLDILLLLVAIDRVQDQP